MPEYDVFLSHNSADKPTVEELARRLVKAGVQPWLDKWNLIPGEPWQKAIEEALDSCATCAIFVGPSGTGPWQNEEMRAAIDRRVSESEGSLRVIPVLLPGAERGERSRLPTFLVATTWVEFRHTLDDEDAFHRLVCGVRGQAPGPAPGEAVYEGQCPYRGLAHFDVEHAPFFFGREALTEWLLNSLQGDSRFLAIIGSSGSGKSSLACAGVLAALQQGRIPGSDEWPIFISRPTANPLERLAIDLSAATEGNISMAIDLMKRMQENENALHVAVDLALHAAPPAQRLVLLEDQFEEMFTLCHDDDVRRFLITNLLYAANAPQGRTIVLLTLRADFYGKCAEYPRLADALSDRSELVGPMTEDELLMAIQRPAQLVGAEFEPGLVEALLRDVRGEPGNLPLLQHALLELWERRTGRKLTHTAYKEIGGVEGALERRAEDVYVGLNAQEREICRRVFLRLTQPGEGTEDTKRRATLQELLPAEIEHEMVEEVVRVLAGEQARLVIIEGDEEQGGKRFVEVAHEALIQCWSRLRGWIEEDREWLRAHRRVTEAAQEWKQRGWDEDFLYRGGRLAVLEEWVKAHADELNTLERDFVRASKQSAQRRRRRTIIWLSTALTLITILAIVSTALGIQSRQRADDLERQSRRRLSSQLASQSAYYRASDPQLALLLAIHAVSTTYDVDGYTTLEANTALRGAVTEAYGLAVVLGGEHTGKVNWAGFSPDGEHIVTASSDGTAHIWNIATGEELKLLSPERQGHTEGVYWAGFSPDGKHIVTAGDDDTARVWDAVTGEELTVLEGHTEDVIWVGFSLDGKRIVTTSFDDTARIWDLVTGEELIVLRGHNENVNAAAFSPDGRILATVSNDGTVRIWNADSGEQLADVGGSIGYSAAFSIDGRHLATAMSDKTVWIWDTESWNILTKLTGHKGPVHDVAFSPDGRFLVTASDDLTSRIWDSSTAEELLILEGHTEYVRSAAFSPDGKRVVTCSWDETTRVWDSTTGEELVVLEENTGRAHWAGFSPDGERIVTANSDGTARVWNVAMGEVQILLGRGSIRRAGFSSDGESVVTISSDNTVYIWDTATGEELAMLKEPASSMDWAELSQDGEQVITISWDGTACVWDTATGTELTVLEGHTDNVNWAGFSLDGKRVATVSDDGTVHVWDVTTGTELAMLDEHTESVNSAGLSPDGKRIVVTSEDNTARVWDVDTGKEIAVLEGHTDDINWAGFSPDGKHIVTAGYDDTARIWDAVAGDELTVLEGHTDDIHWAEFSPDGEHIITGSSDNTSRVWHTITGEEVAVLRGHKGNVNWAEFSPDGERIATVSNDDTVHIYEQQITSLGQVSLVGHESGVWRAVFDSSGQWVASVGQDGTARIWNTETGEETVRLEGHGKGFESEGERVECSQCINAVAFSPSGDRVATAGWDGTARIWDVQYGKELVVLEGHSGCHLRWGRDGTNMGLAEWQSLVCVSYKRWYSIQLLGFLA
jgi:WD40 repeat protein